MIDMTLTLTSSPSPADAPDLTRLVELTDELALLGQQSTALYREWAEEIRQNAAGRVLVGCHMCDGEFYVPKAAAGRPVLCRACDYADRFWGGELIEDDGTGAVAP
jgi:hypothetical protein